jgi:lysophospholipase L1-like esterase
MTMAAPIPQACARHAIPTQPVGVAAQRRDGLSRLAGLLLALLPALAIAAEPAPPITLRDREVIVFLGDSITEFHQWTAVVESFLVTRLPDQDLSIYNYGWAGEHTYGGEGRFVRDIAPLKPTLVLTAYGMNDGGYVAKPDAGIQAHYRTSQGKLADAVKAVGARQVLLTTSPVDPSRTPDRRPYNDALAVMAEDLLALGAQRGLASIDVFKPMLAVQTAAQQADPAFTMVPDWIHPDAVGGLVMAHTILSRFDLPRSLGRIAVAGSTVTAEGGAGLTITGSGTDGFTGRFSLARLPCPVPPAARPALRLVPFQEQLNRIELRVAGLAPDGVYDVLSGERELVSVRGAQLAAGIDLAAYPAAPWLERSQRIWELGQVRQRHHLDAWRRIDLAGDLAAGAAIRSAARIYTDALASAMRAEARPGSWPLSVRRSQNVLIERIELSPLTPYNGDFAAVGAAERAPDTVTWTTLPFAGQLDLAQVFGAAGVNCQVHARLVLAADRACTLRLASGSDEGLVVSLGGKRHLALDLCRGLRPEEDHCEVPLVKGRNTLILRVNQSSGGFGLALKASVAGPAEVVQVDSRAP